MILRKERNESSRIITTGFKKANFSKLKKWVHKVTREGILRQTEVQESRGLLKSGS